MSTTIDGDVRTYLAAVRDQLEDLPPQERDDLLEDLEQHLIEVSAEGDGTLVDKLGEPNAFAAELRSSAGLSEPDSERPALRARLRARVLRSWIGRALRTAPARSLRAFWPELRPGWWVLRGYLAMVFLWGATGSNGDLEVIPNETAAPVLDLAILITAMWLSVRLARRAHGRRLRTTSIVVNAAALLGMIVLASTDASMQYVSYTDEGPGYIESLHHPDGSPILNICPYTATGESLGEVLLFDQNGRRIENVALSGEVLLRDEDGAFVPAGQDPRLRLPNSYPRDLYVLDDEGNPHVIACPVLASPAPTASPSASASPQPRSSR